MNILNPLPPICGKLMSSYPSVFVEGMSYQEQIAIIRGLLNSVIDSQNKTIENVNELEQDFKSLNNNFVELKKFVDDYFKNLDVQDEINNKLEEMYENGDFDTLFSAIDRTSRANSNFVKGIGFNTWFTNYSAEKMKTISNLAVGKFAYCNFQFDVDVTETGIVTVNEERLANQVAALLEYQHKGGEVVSLKIHDQPKFYRYATSENIEYFLENLYNAIEKIKGLIPFDLNEVIVLGEESKIYTNVAFKTAIMNFIAKVKLNLYDRISIAFKYASEPGEVDSDIINSLDFISIDCYPLKQFGSPNTAGLSDAQWAFENEFISGISSFYGKEVWITEYGCAANVNCMNNPSTWQGGTDGRPVSLFLEGILKSSFGSYCSRFFVWYFEEALNFGTETLLSINNERVLRYGNK